MKFFVSHSSRDKGIAERIALSLRNLGHEAFFDRDSLPPGSEYDNRIRSEVGRCDRFVFCLTNSSLKEGSYALTELAFARQRWEHPKDRVLTVVLDDTAIEDVPAYLAAATVLRPVGNVAAEVAGHVAHIDDNDRRFRSARMRWIAAGLVTVALAVAATWYLFSDTQRTPYELANERLRVQLPERPGYRSHVYPRFGFGFLAPRSWQIEDSAAAYNVPDIDIVQRYTEEKAAIGVEFRLIPVQPNYINDVEAEIENQADVLRAIDSELRVADTTVSGVPAKSFRYRQRTGQRIGDINRIWLRLVPEVKLQVLSFTYADEPDRVDFADEVRRITESIVIDQELLSTVVSGM
jgi:hypothetical protein